MEAVPQLADQPSRGTAVDATALAELFRRHHGDLVRLATVMLRSREAAEDVVQDVFAGMQARSGKLMRPEAALPYLRAAVLNRCRSVIRRQALAQRFGGLRDLDFGLAQLSAEADVIAMQPAGVRG
jgi:DNA-directed RNA polymerase specialized sigma24 family protein